MSKRLKVLIPTALFLTVLVITVFNMPGLVQAIGRWIGYVPGLGIVPENMVLTLTDPIRMTQDGYTLTISELTASSQKTAIKLDLSTIPDEAIRDDQLCRSVEDPSQLIFDDGTQADLIDMAWDLKEGSILMDVSFSGIPEGVEGVTLVLNCIAKTDPEIVPWIWEVPIRFDMTSISTVVTGSDR